jgi:hypothetical protein
MPKKNELSFILSVSQCEKREWGKDVLAFYRHRSFDVKQRILMFYQKVQYLVSHCAT